MRVLSVIWIDFVREFLTVVRSIPFMTKVARSLSTSVETLTVDI